MEFRTCESVLSWLDNQVREKRVISPTQWIEAAEYLNILRSEPQEELFILQQKIAEAKVIAIKEGNSSAAAKIIVESTDLFRQSQSLGAKLVRIDEAIRLAKHHSRLASAELLGK